jgi:hypothetical protein
MRNVREPGSLAIHPELVRAKRHTHVEEPSACSRKGEKFDDQKDA